VQIIRKNFGLKILSLALAVIGWAYFRYASNPVLGARFDQQVTIPLAIAHLAEGYIARPAEKSAVITVAGRRGDPAPRSSDVQAILDLTGKDAGVYNVPVELIAPNVSIQSLSPASVTVTVERR
jgi:hypothetical protein